MYVSKEMLKLPGNASAAVGLTDVFILCYLPFPLPPLRYVLHIWTLHQTSKWKARLGFIFTCKFSSADTFEHVCMHVPIGNEMFNLMLC